MHGRLSTRFPRSSDPGSPFLNLLWCCASTLKVKAILCHTRCFSSCGTFRSKIGRRHFCGSVCRIFETALDTTLLKILSPRCDPGYISCRRRAFRLKFEYNVSRTGCEKAENSAKRNTKKGTVYGDRESEQFAKLLARSGVAVV
jgi:hypothetical protein